ncbi:hypothetical protein [Burkholderia sp. Bp9142]|uniref:hypothetical protein n=1 Tax=Burkholderia sp. Bp9142 TaxID=2184573 RepID=UPI000F5B2648|nr:hypothetical protein [Burkholderia sp. Bp9142]RQR40631.1 hypothetical protein DIE22_05060 [Burkholderia sp. Bp9142]
MSSATPYSCRAMTPADATWLTKNELLWLAPPALTTELAAPDFYTWMGLFFGDELIALHRGMRWGSWLLFKGLIVAPAYRGSPAGIQLAIALREYARSIGYAGVIVWVEPGKPERGIAAMLRMKRHGPLVHRFEFPLPCAAECLARGFVTPIYANRISIRRRGRPMVPNLVASSHDGGSVFYWVSDDGRLVLSGNPCGSVEDLPDLISEVVPIAQSVGATAIEFPILAHDVEAMIAFVSKGARRLSRTPVYLGLHMFDACAPACESSGAEDSEAERCAAR